MTRFRMSLCEGRAFFMTRFRMSLCEGSKLILLHSAAIPGKLRMHALVQMRKTVSLIHDQGT